MNGERRDAAERPRLIVAYLSRGRAHDIAAALHASLGIDAFHYGHGRGAGMLSTIAARDMVEVDLWPLGLVVPWPLFVYVLLGTGIGLLMGALVAWISAGPARKLARERRARLRELEHTIETMQARLDAGEPKLPARPPALPE